MLAKNIYRGNIITFTSTFYDANNAVINPSAPTLSVHYKSNNVYLTVTSNLVHTGNVWVGTWDSSNADPGLVEWHIAGGAGALIAEDGSFQVLANKANPSA